MHRYVFSGEKGTGFQWEFTHPELLAPLQEWGQGIPKPSGAVLDGAALELAEAGYLAKAEARTLLVELSEVPPTGS
jgi:hypothetical protein